MTNTAERIEIVALPKTLAAIKSEFPGRSNAGLRRELYDTARHAGRVAMVARRVALTGCGKASLQEVDAVCRAEYEERGYNLVAIGYGDPLIYGEEIVAYLDQPIDG